MWHGLRDFVEGRKIPIPNREQGGRFRLFPCRVLSSGVFTTPFYLFFPSMVEKVFKIYYHGWIPYLSVVTHKPLLSWILHSDDSLYCFLSWHLVILPPCHIKKGQHDAVQTKIVFFDACLMPAMLCALKFIKAGSSATPGKNPRLPRRTGHVQLRVSHRTWAKMSQEEVILGSTSLGQMHCPVSWALHFLPHTSSQPTQIQLHISLPAQVCLSWGPFSRWDEGFASGCTRGSTSSVSPQCLYVFFLQYWQLGRVEYSLTASFDEGDPAYEWIILFLVRPLPYFAGWLLFFTRHDSDRQKSVGTIPLLPRHRNNFSEKMGY